MAAGGAKSAQASSCPELIVFETKSEPKPRFRPWWRRHFDRRKVDDGAASRLETRQLEWPLVEHLAVDREYVVADQPLGQVDMV